MAIDFQVAFPREAVQLNRIQVVPGLVPRSLRVTGTDFRSVDEVLVNQIPSPDVVIMSKTTLIAQIPKQLKQDRITTVSVLNRRLALTPRSFMEFQISKNPSKVRGILRLVQLFLKILFTTPGTDIFAPRIGGAGLRNIGQTIGGDEGGQVVQDFIIAVDNTSRQIVASQSRDPRIPRDERLLAANVTSIGFNKNETALIVTVELTSQAGRTVRVNLEL